MNDLVHTLCIHYLAVKDSDIIRISESLKLLNSEKITFNIDYDWGKVYNNNEMLIINSTTQWNYIVFNISDIHIIKNISEKLSKDLKTTINYFFIDPWQEEIRWVNFEKGNLNRSYCLQYEDEYENFGTLSAENQLKNIEPKIQQIEEIDIIWNETAKLYWNLSDHLSPSISTLNQKSEYEALQGELDKTAYNNSYENRGN